MWVFYGNATQTTEKLVTLRDLHNLKVSVNECHKDVAEALQSYTKTKNDDNIQMLVNDNNTVHLLSIHSVTVT